MVFTEVNCLGDHAEGGQQVQVCGRIMLSAVQGKFSEIAEWVGDTVG